MECHYKVLGVELNADDDQIKKAYRKAALKYHPDKNLHCLEEATEKFRLVQAAYDVLSDPQERGWYDRHREEILHRKKYENYKDNSLDLWDFFSPSAYKGFGNDENGFYSVYGDVFRKIDAEDEPFRSDDSDHEPMPCFGDADSDYDEVVHVFYSEWQAYCTHLSFVWENQYDVKEAPNRRVARIIEKENKKERDKHKKKRNELVRELVAFVRKRDPRVKAHKVELENLAAEKAAKAEEHRASVLRQRVEKAAEYDEANKEEMMKHHERVAELENLMKDEFGFSSEDEKDSQDEQDSEEEEEYKDELFCVACNKLFKSEMGLRNHEKSKKHKESVNRLREEMKNDESIDDDYVKRNQEEISHDHDIEEIKSGGKMSKRQKKQKRQQQKLLDNSMAAEPIKVEDFDDANVKTVSYDKTTNEGLSQESPNCNDEPVSETLPQEDGTVTIDESENMVSEPTHSDSTTTTTTSNTKKAKHKKQKQQKPANSHPDSNSESLGCGKCSRVFQSRNKLFQHLKQTGHSLPLENGKSSKRKEKRSRN